MQTIELSLYEELSGKSFVLHAEPVHTHYLTEQKGKMVCFDDFSTYHYNYDNAGICAEINLTELIQYVFDNKEQNRFRWLFVVDYVTPISAGSRVPRGVSPGIRRKITDFRYQTEYKGQRYEIKSGYDQRQTVFFEVNTE